MGVTHDIQINSIEQDLKVDMDSKGNLLFKFIIKEDQEEKEKDDGTIHS